MEKDAKGFERKDRGGFKVSDLDSLLKSAPDHILHHFACDCAERTLMRVADNPKKVQALDLLGKKRAGVEGEISNEELAAYRAAYRAADWAAYWATDWATDRAAFSAADRAERGWQKSRLLEMIEEYAVHRQRLIAVIDRIGKVTEVAVAAWVWESGEEVFS